MSRDDHTARWRALPAAEREVVLDHMHSDARPDGRDHVFRLARAVLRDVAHRDIKPHNPVTISDALSILPHLLAHDRDEITVGRLVELLNEAGFRVGERAGE